MRYAVVAAAIAAGGVVASANADTLTSSASANPWYQQWGTPTWVAGGPGAEGGNFSPLVDGEGDAQDTFGAGPPLLDIDTMSVSYSGGNLFFEMTFHTPIAPASAAVPESLFGIFEFDTDQNAGTGFAPLQNAFSPPFAALTAGVDFFLDFNSDLAHPGQFDVIDVNDGPIGTVDAVFGDMSVAATIPLAMLGGDDGLLDFTTTIGTGPQPTDATNVVGTSVPAPGALALLAIGGVAASRRRR